MNFINSFFKQNISLLLLLVVVVVLLGKQLNPFSPQIFLFHDVTQAARITEFKYAFLSGQILPRIAPHFSFNLGYPIFTFYAPGAYIISNIFSLFNFSPPDVIQVSFLASILVGLIGADFFFKKNFCEQASLFGGAIYITSLYVPLSIFVRGNLAESWLIALLPWGFYSLLPVEKITSRGSILRVIVLTLLLTSHNGLSLFVGFYLLLFLVVTQASKKQWIIFTLGFFGSFYFYLPFILESSLTRAKTVALKTNINDHFLCVKQLWSGDWGFGGSAPGCLNDGMSFKVGKIHLGLLTTSAIAFFWHLSIKRDDKKLIANLTVFFIFVTMFLLFMTTGLSKLIWNQIEFLKLMQYSWRLLAIAGIGFAWAGAFSIEYLPKQYKTILSYSLIAITLMITSKYFYGQKILKSQFAHEYLSRDYISTKAAYQAPEYLPKTVNYDYWRSFEPTDNQSNLPIFSQPAEITGGKYEIIKNNPFQKIIKVQPQDQLTINIHYLSSWKIVVNDKQFIPDKKNLDDLGRPFLSITEPSIIQIYYKQTSIQMLGIFSLIMSVIIAGWLPVLTYAKRKRN